VPVSVVPANNEAKGHLLPARGVAAIASHEPELGLMFDLACPAGRSVQHLDAWHDHGVFSPNDGGALPRGKISVNTMHSVPIGLSARTTR